MNQNLKNALQDAGLTVEECADIIQVDPKTVGRWLAGASTPYPRHRAKITRALALTETDLWPDHADTAEPAAGLAATEQDAIRVWAYSTDQDAPDPVGLVNTATSVIDVLDGGLWFDLAHGLADALTGQADQGRAVRILTGSPSPRLKPLAVHPHIALRISPPPGFYTLIRTDERLLFTFLLPGELAEPPQLLEARRGAGGLFDRLTQNYEQFWDDPEEIITDPEQLEQYRTNADDDYGDSDDDDALAAPSPATSTADSVSEPPAARRWPRRPAS